MKRLTGSEWLDRVATLPPVARRLALSLVAFDDRQPYDGPTRLALQAHALDATVAEVDQAYRDMADAGLAFFGPAPQVPS